MFKYLLPSSRFTALAIAIGSTLCISSQAMGQGANPQSQGPNQHAVSMYNLGLNAFNQGSPESAVIFFKRASDIDPNLADAQYNLGVIYQSQRRYKEAVPRFKEVLRIKPNDADAHYQLGVTYMGLGDFNSAITEFNTIAPNNPHFADAQKKVQECNQRISGGSAAGTSVQAGAVRPLSPEASAGAAPTLYTPPAGNLPVQSQSGSYQSGTAVEPVAKFNPNAANAEGQLASASSTSSFNNASSGALQQSTFTQQSSFSQQPSYNQQSTYTQRAVPQQSSAVQTTGGSGYTPPVASKPTAVLANSTVRVIATGFRAPSGLTFDKFGNLYVANFDSNTVDRISRDGTRSQFSTGGHLNGPIGLVSDDSGNVYVANYKGGTIARITPAGISTVIATGFKSPYYLTLDKGGNLFVSQQEDNSIIRITLPGPGAGNSGSPMPTASTPLGM